jgi:hypothetical protein
MHCHVLEAASRAAMPVDFTWVGTTGWHGMLGSAPPGQPNCNAVQYNTLRYPHKHHWLRPAESTLELTGTGTGRSTGTGTGLSTGVCMLVAGGE